ncbi:hypothetical protein ABPG72_019365 [Tetrahymena utriculariae]
MSQTFAHDSFLGGLNLFKRRDPRFVLDQGERPPYPIINSNSSFVDVLNNFNKADFGLVLFSGAIGFPLSRWVLKGLTFSSLNYRRGLFSSVYGGIIFWGLVLGFNNSYYRLNGFVDNGLVWKKKERKLNKYDFTSEFEDNSFFKKLRIRD